MAAMRDSVGPRRAHYRKSYEFTGWIRTEKFTVRDLDRSPIATGAALAMASMPYDMQSESLAGTRDWTRVQLRFTATRSQDNILLTAATAGRSKAKPGFRDQYRRGFRLRRLARARGHPTYGPAYRYPVGGWLYLHIEGQPYERGYQHGRPDGQRDRSVHGALRRPAGRKDKDQSWDCAHHRQCAFSTRF